jgi:ParB family transcriptional regulator, chromosome partitioning protein
MAQPDQATHLLL